MARLDLTADYVNKYTELSGKMLDKGSIFEKQLDLMKQKFDEFGLTNEQLAEATSTMFVQVTIAYNKDAIGATNALLKQEADEPNSEARTKATLRQIQGYDDNILIKVGEQKGSVASFAVNAGSNSAQGALNNMNSTMALLEQRVTPLSNTPVCPALPVIVQIPENLGYDTKTETEITLSWSTVVNATSYELFVDGVSISTTGQSIQTIDSLLPDTKYSFNIRAYIGTDISDLSQTVVVQTDATI